MSRVAATLCRLLSPPADRRTDGALLSAFLHDQDEAAFEELVRRHGPLVWGLCRRTLPDPADAEDAFQASFLVLVRRANRLTTQATVGPWLYKVAAWTARNLRRRNARQLARRVPLCETTADRKPGPEATDLAADLDAALLTLPEKYRTPLILCHLQGWSRRDAAERLRVPEGTLSALLSRGLSKLRDRLAGHDPLKALGAGSTVVPALLVATTARAAGAARLALAGSVSASVSQLVEGVLHMFWVQKATAASLGLVVVFGLGLGVGLSVQQGPRASADDTAPVVRVPVVEDDAAEDVTALVRKLTEVEEEVKVADDKARSSEEKLRRVAKLFAENKATLAEVADDADEVKRIKQELEKAEKLRADLIARIKAMEEGKSAKKALTENRKPSGPPPSNPAEAKPEPPRKAPTPPQPPQPKKSTAGNPFRSPDTADPKASDELKRITAQLQELEAMQQKLQADRAKLQADTEIIRARAAEMAAREKERAARDRGRTEEKVERIVTVRAGYLEVVVGGRDAWWPCWVKEYGSDGKPVGSVICDTVPMLSRFLARTKSDPKAPQDLRVTIQPGANQDRTDAVLEACKVAGFRTTRTGTRSADTPGRAAEMIELELRGAGQGLRVIGDGPNKEKLLQDLNKQLGDGLNKRIVDEVIRNVDRATRDGLLQKEEAMRALEEAQKRLKDLEKLKELKPDAPKPKAPKPPTPSKPPTDPDGDDA